MFGASSSQMSAHAAATTLGHLVATLNATFPDYDFSTCTGPESFSRIPLGEAQTSVNAALAACRTFTDAMRAQLWSLLEKEVLLHQAEVYSFLPPPDADPFAEDGCAWALCYFFYSRPQKRLALFTLRCQRGPGNFRSTSTAPMEDDDLQFAADAEDDMV